MKTLPEVDVAIVGMGWAGSILAKELAQAGLRVVGLERGRLHASGQDFAVPWVRDELRYARRNELMVDPARTTVTVRNHPGQTALPMRRLGSFLPGEGVGGSGIHWGALSLRWNDNDFRIRSRERERYGERRLEEGVSLHDWGIGYDDLEPYYDRFERMAAVSGSAGNVEGRIDPAGNPFEAPRRRGYALPALHAGMAGEVFSQAAASLDLHPFTIPMARASEPYTNPDGSAYGACEYCGHCGGFGCEVDAKASPHHTVIPQALKQPTFELRTHAWATRIERDRSSGRATGVRYVDLLSGQERFQPAAIVVLASFALGNVHLMLLSSIGEPYDPHTGRGVVGRNYAYQANARAAWFFDERHFNPFMSGAMSALDDFHGNARFDRAALGVAGGYIVYGSPGPALPIGARLLPPGAPAWGREWKRAAAHWYPRTMTVSAQASVMAHRHNYLDLDPTYRDAMGNPLLRMTFEYGENERRLVRHAAGVLDRLAAAAAPTRATPAQAIESWSVLPYQSTHPTGGTIMGGDPRESVTNGYGQCWSAHNLFVAGASLFPHNSAYPPTELVCALAYRTADAIRARYVRRQELLA